MLFNSYEFVVFLTCVFFLYWFVFNRDIRTQNILLIVASYVFYGWWDWRFLTLIVISSLVDYCVGLLLGHHQDPIKRKLILFLSISVNIGFLAFFKYFNFFIDTFNQAFANTGLNLHMSTLKIILPIGISFYTFQTLSYSIDVYRKKQEPTRDLIAFFAYVSFFPQLVAGPIERARHFLPQFLVPRCFEYEKASDGMRQILLGVLKKVVIADNCAPYVNDIFANYQSYSGSTLVLGAVLFAFQIYGDFSGYSDIAIGTARLFGINLSRNFAYPYFSRDIAEFWRRWHISLSSWFKDYLYIPLGGSRCRDLKKIRNTLIVFILSGFWHGANWTFLVWGFLNALYLFPLMLTNRNRINLQTVSECSHLPSVKETAQIVATFGLTCIGWIFFRGESLAHSLSYLKRIFSISIFTIPDIEHFPKKLICFIVVLIILEWFQRDKQHAFELQATRMPKLLRWFLYYSIVVFIFLFGNFESSYEFIYFQF